MISLKKPNFLFWRKYEVSLISLFFYLRRHSNFFDSMNYQRINNVVGWIAFLIASFTFISTIEPTGSFWDCGEFIATAHKLEVGHPPGAPFFLMLARVFILFAGDDISKIPIMVNILSALMSAFTILFLFWTITALAKKLVLKKAAELTTDKIIAIM